MDIREICLDEVSLEGLDGITIPTLWLRLQTRQPAIKVQLTERIKEYLWRFLVQHDEINVYKIPSERLHPQIFDRFSHVEEHTVPVARSPDELDAWNEVYSSEPVTNGTDGERGACSDYETRALITKEIRSFNLDMDEALSKYGPHELVIVASQNLREQSILQQNFNPKALKELTEIAYCVVEHLGRSRWQGDLQAILNKQVFANKPYHIHYIIKKLYRFGLVVKTPYTYKREDRNGRTVFQILLHLSRFGRDCRSTLTKTMDHVRETLEQSPGNCINMLQLREQLKMGQRTFKALYQNIVKSGLAVISNIDPTKKTANLSGKILTLNKNYGDDGDDEEDEDDVDFADVESTSSSIVLEQPVIHQSFAYVLQKGSEGVTQREMLNFLKGYGKLEARNICRSFERMKLVKTILVDHGKQRTQKHIPIDFAKLNLNTKEFTQEKAKMQKLLSESAVKRPQRDQSGGVDCEDVSAAMSLVLGSNCNGLFDDDHHGSSNEIFSPSPQKSLTEDSFSINGITESPNDTSDSISSDKNAHNQRKKWDANLTTRKMKRHNTVLETLKNLKVIESFRVLQNILAAAEEMEGVKTKVDKKTVKRLITKMHEDGFLRYTVIPVEYNNTVHRMDFIMSIDCDDNMLQSAIERAKFKLLSEEQSKEAKLEPSPHDTKLGSSFEEELPTLLNFSLDDLTDENSSLLKNRISGPELSTSFEILPRFQPKYKRARVVHELLWYLAYGHPYSKSSRSCIDIDSSRYKSPKKSLEDSVNSTIYNLDEACVYLPENSWRRFLPPVPRYEHEGTSWLQLGDISVILPVAVLCQFHRASCNEQELTFWLEQDKNRFALVRHLPLELRSSLLHKRKYILSFVACLEQLAFMGLLTVRKIGTLNPCLAPKESWMMYVHKNASIYDTTTSSKQHMKVDEKEYDKVSIQLDSFDDVSEYWRSVEDICLRTPLGYLNLRDPNFDYMNGHYGTVETKKFYAKHLEQEGKPRDDGEIPGNHRGAGGFDSSMYTHVVRNWSFSTSLKRRSMMNMTPKESKLGIDNKSLTSEETPADNKITSPPHTEVNNHLDVSLSILEETEDSKIKKAPQKKSRKRKRSEVQKQVKISECEGVNVSKCPSGQDIIVKTVSNIGRNEKVKGGRGVKRKSLPHEPCSHSKKMKMKLISAARKHPSGDKVAKVIMHGKQRVKYYDETDKKALDQRKGKIRVSFTNAEDSLLLICRVVSTLLSMRYRLKGHRVATNLLPWSIVRDMLQGCCPESCDKTTYSVSRRVRFFMKNRETKLFHDIFVTDVSSDKQLMDSMISMKDEHKTMDFLCKSFCRFVLKLRKRFQGQPGLFSGEIHNTVTQMEADYRIMPISANEYADKRKLVNKEITSTSDIVRCVLENVIYTCLSLKGNSSSIHKAFRIFDSFPNNLIEESFERMRALGVVTSKMEPVRDHSKFGVPSHQLSMSHSFTFKTTVPQRVMQELWFAVNSIRQKDLALEMHTPLGVLFILSYLFHHGFTDVGLDIPDQIILPDDHHHVFENQFLIQMKEAEKEVEKHLQKQMSSGKDEQGDERNQSFLAAASKVENWTTLASSNSQFDESLLESDTQMPQSGDSKLSEVFRLYQRHPSYTNWLLLTNPVKSVKLKSKFSTLNYSVNSENVVLSPCGITIQGGRESSEFLDRMWSSSSDLGSLNDSLIKSLQKQAELILCSLRSRIFEPSKGDIEWSKLQAEMDPMENLALTMIFETLDYAGERGMAESEVRRNEGGVEFDAMDGINILLERDIVWQVGTEERRFVLYKHVKTWMTRGVRQKKFENDTDPPQEGEDGGEVNEEANSSCVPDSDSFYFLCRPWHTYSGDINYKTAKSMLISLFLKILSSPGITFEQLKYSYDFQPICILELLSVLCNNGCVDEMCIDASEPRRMFGVAKTKKKTYYEASDKGQLVISSLTEVFNNFIERKNMDGDTQDGLSSMSV